MRKPLPSRLAALLLALAVTACTTPRAAPAPASLDATTVIVVRHAERASETDRDSPLSEAGEARAAALAETLADAGVVAIYATQYQRTQQTAAPLARRLGIAIEARDAADPTIVAREVLERHRGGTVLLVGHSNTVTALVRALGGSAGGDLSSGDYDDLFLVRIPAAGPARTIHSRYGPPSA